jgi:hypothetical protein
MRAIRNSWTLAGLLAGTALLGGGFLGMNTVDTADAKPKPAALAAFDTIQTVLQHPRCQNCHIPGDAPLQFDAGLVHAQNVKRGPDGHGAPGLPCSACGAHMPPGAPKWALPPPERKMVFINLPGSELCANLKDTKRNGGKDLAALLEHVDHDKLVLWGWDPGVGRAPVSVPHDQFVAAFKTWVDAGAPCPAPGVKTVRSTAAAGRR